MRILSFTICFFCAVCMFSQTDSSKRKPRISNTTSQNDVKKKEPTTSTSNLYSPTGYNNGHGYVDLGLSVKWATCNIGAKNPGDWGNYYAWGEVRTKSVYTWSTYFDCSDGMGKSFRQYNIKEGQKQIAPTSGHDVSRVQWGGSWRIPTQDEIEELISKCTWKFSKAGGHDGYKITGPSGKSIFLPVAGRYTENGLIQQGQFGTYWSSSLEYSKGNSFYCGDDVAAAMNFYWRFNNTGGGCKRYEGCPVRSVCD